MTDTYRLGLKPRHGSGSVKYLLNYVQQNTGVIHELMHSNKTGS